jgi:3-methyladenine DNA glycosylase AlkC
MSTRLKDLFFSSATVDQLGDSIQQHHVGFDKEQFAQRVFDEDWESRELKARMRHVTQCLHETLPDDYTTALEILKQVAPGFSGFDAMVFPDYVECYGLDHWELSLPALALFTTRCSSEFAIRPFIAQDPERAMATMREWAKDENEHVRRLASEGCRPRLPWATALPIFKKDPSLILPVLEALKEDEAEYVRKSVANNLNDISKDHPELVLDICERWYGHSKRTDWIVKHACRTMLKAGNRRAMMLFGFGNPTHISVHNLCLGEKVICIGDDLPFTFELSVDGDKTCLVRLEMKVTYAKARGKQSTKIFQIKEHRFDPGRHPVGRKHSFRDLSTRKHYPGVHQISIIVNGVEKATAGFELLDRAVVERE